MKTGLKWLVTYCVGAVLALALSGLTVSELAAASLFARKDQQPVPLVPVSVPVGPQTDPLASEPGSLFAGRDRGTLFAPLPKRLKSIPDLSEPIQSYMMPLKLPEIAALRSLIASVEAGAAQYDAVVFSARIKPPKRPTDMTLGEIYQWIKATPGQNHAIGRYQFIPSTLKEVVGHVGAPVGARFTPALQDRLADVLLMQAGLSEYLQGALSEQVFMHNLARVWAGLPTSSGKSYYEGVAGNKAGMSWGRFQREMARIFPNAQRADS